MILDESLTVQMSTFQVSLSEKRQWTQMSIIILYKSR